MTSKKFNDELSADDINSTKFTVYHEDIKLNSDTFESLAFHSYLWFKQSMSPLYIYVGVKVDESLENLKDYVNLGLFNDNDVLSTDSRAIPKEKVLYSVNELESIFQEQLTKGQKYFELNGVDLT